MATKRRSAKKASKQKIGIPLQAKVKKLARRVWKKLRTTVGKNVGTTAGTAARKAGERTRSPRKKKTARSR
jgi:hypothetical protein